MSSKPCIILIFCILLQLLVLTISQDATVKYYCNYDYAGTYTNASAFQRNIQNIPTVLNRSDATFYNFSLGEKNISTVRNRSDATFYNFGLGEKNISTVSNRPDATFYNFPLGEKTDTINVIALCRGDLGVNRCRRCLTLAYSELTGECTKEKESVIWKDECMLRYSDRAIFKTVNSLPNALAYNEILAADGNDFNKKVRNLLDRLEEKAAAGNFSLKFATGNSSVTENTTVHGLVQCTPDLTAKQCKDCLDGAFQELPRCCDGKIGGREVRPSCNFRYETGSAFYNGNAADIPPQSAESPLPSTPSSPTSETGSGDSKTKIIIIVAVVTTTIFLILVCSGISIYYHRNKKQRNLEDNYDALDDMISEESLFYDFDTIKLATEDFSDDNKLGEGGFGVVYKGRLPDGREIAVKRLSRNSGQGELEFKNEVLLLAKLQHRSLLRLLGYSLKATERLLIYEFIPKGSLDNFIFDGEKRQDLDAETRFKIINGVARGLLYLHEDSRLRIIHRDLKPSNILLDAEMYPKIADFGMARLFEAEETRAATNRIVGTYGYMAPEYAMLGQFSVKSDVFSFGVVVLEIITGQKNNFRNGENIEYLPSYVWKNWRDGRVSDVIDPMLRNSTYSVHEMRRCIHIALLCVQENTADRPTMASIAVMLSSASFSLQVPSEPAFLNNTGSQSVFQDHTLEVSELSSSKSMDMPLISTQNDASITDLTGR